MITNGLVVTMNPGREIVENGAVAIDGADIVAVGPDADVTARFSGRDTLDARGQIVLPGLINTHTHAPMVLYRGLADDLALSGVAGKHLSPPSEAVSPTSFAPERGSQRSK